MDIFLKNEKEKEIFHFPVNPFAITIDKNKRYETADIWNFGEVDFCDKGENIDTISFEVLFPRRYDSFCRYSDVPDPIKSMEKLEKWMKQEEPVRLIITDFNFNSLVTIASISENERGGESGDKYVSLEFRKWRQVQIRKVKIKKPSKSSGGLKRNRPKPKPKKRYYTVRRGDSLWKISKKYYGKGSQWRKIYNANRKKIGKNPNRIYPGQRFVIPR